MKRIKIRYRRLLTGIILVLGIGGLCACKGQVHELILLHTNDSHGSIVPMDRLGGMAERAAFVRTVRQNHQAVLLLDAGDINTGQAVSNMFDAYPDVISYNDMGYDAVTVGNHEFDKPISILQQQMQWAEFPFVISNVDYQGKPLGKEYLLKEIGGVKVGIFGLTTTNTKNISVNVAALNFRDEIETAGKMVKLLREQKAEVIIGLVHLGFTKTTPDFITSLKLAAAVDGIDILVDGHSHSYVERPVRVNNTWIVTANQSGRFVGKGILKIENGHLVKLDWEPVKIQGIPPDSALTEKLRPYLEAADRDLGTIVGEAGETFPLLADGENLTRYQETALGDLVADAMKWKTEHIGLKSDFALINSGSIREALLAGKITKKNILSVLPFANELEIVDLSGKQIKCLFDFVARVVPGNGAFAQVSREVQVTYDRKNGRVKRLLIGGQAVEDERLYHMATSDYVAAGKDGYRFGLGRKIRHEKTSRLLSDVLIEYISREKKIFPQTDGRISFIE